MPLPRSKNGTLVPVPCNSTSIPVSCFFVQEKIPKLAKNLWRPVFCILTSTPGLHYRCEFRQTKTNVANSSWRVPHIHTSTKEVCLKIMSYPNSELCTRVGHALFFIILFDPQPHGHLCNTREPRILRNEKKFLVIDVISQPTVSANVGRAKIRCVPQPDQEGRAKEIHCQPYKWISESKNINSFKVIILARFLTNFSQINLTSSTKKSTVSP